MIDTESDPGSWARFLAQRDGTRFITQPGEDGIERQLPDDRREESRIGLLNLHEDAE